METARSGQYHDVGVGIRQHRIQRSEAWSPGALDRPLESRRVDVAHPDQLGPLGMLLKGVEVVAGNPPAPRQREADLSV
jgi:hypothetical protein